jgi:DNA (cytosine-5)-methyltransferase 1
MKYISICSGIEAASVAWHGLGWTPLAFSEIEPFPAAVLSERWASVPNLGDMTKFREWPEELLVECDLLVGGTPCQAFSVAGLRKSLDDERGNLSLIYVQLLHHINEVRRKHGRSPAIAVWENVPGVLSTKDNAFGCFISGLLGLDDTVETQDGKWPKAGFLGSETVRVGYRVLDAQYFAVAQRRRRVFLVAVPCELVASLGERACPSEILSLRESVLGNPPTRGKAWEGVARATAASLASSGRGAERPGESRGQDDVVVSCPPTARTLTQRMHKGFDSTLDSTLDSQTPIITSKPISFHPTQDPISSVDGSTHAMGCGSKGGCCTQAVAFDTTQITSKANYSKPKPGDPCHLLAACTHPPAIAITTEQTPKFNNVCAFAQNQLGEVRDASGRNTPMVHSAMHVRRLTPVECCRLQGFPDDHCDITFRKKPAADGPKYRALGNSMAVPCMAWIGYRIHQATE